MIEKPESALRDGVSVVVEPLVFDAPQRRFAGIGLLREGMYQAAYQSTAK
jgi:hypothetical protein